MMNHSGAQNRLPLEGLLVVDLTRMIPGPLCTMLLGDYGAEVIKIEDVEAGDPTRFVGPAVDGSGPFFRQLNRNKKSLALNLKSPEGKEVIRKLVKSADVLVEGFRPGVMARLGLDYESLKAINNRLIYASISGYGQQGKYRERAGHDINYTAISGLLDLSTGKAGGPVMPAVQIADIAGGSLTAVNGIMFALYDREKSGRGSYLDVAMTRGLLPWLTYAVSAINAHEEVPGRERGQITGAYACYNIYETADGGYMSLGALEPVFWQRFCESVNRKEWVELQFDNLCREKLIAEVKAIFKKKTRKEWEEHFITIDACCEPVLQLDEAIKHQVSREGKYWIKNRIRDGKEELMTGFPILFNGTTGEIRLQPPRHGEHTDEILKSLGYNADMIKEMAGKRLVHITTR
ncbi:MAG: CoA transferase [Firmicutes bacterium]|nr:CoA transferase [Bacillota bacterium]